MPFNFLCCVRPGVEDIVELDYSHQSLTDVPTDVFIYERTLEKLLCQCNRITELPRQLFMCHGLKYLDLSDNELQAIPSAISSLVNLQYLNINRNTLASIPDSMKALKHLLFLDLSVNPLEKLPDTITNLIALQELYLNDTYLEYLPGNFGRLAHLRILELRDNYLMILPKSLSRSTELLRLDIGQNEFQQFPEVIGRFLKLKELWIDGNSFTSITSVIKPLENLVHLEASNNMIDELAPEIGYCIQLQDLCLSINNLTHLPDTIGKLSNLTSLKLDNNRLYSIPESIGQLKNLEELMLMSNYLDNLPSSIGLLRKLQYLNVDENMLRFIPPEIGSCSKLSVLSLRSNKLAKVPPEVGHLTSLRVLNLVRNSLSFLPQSLLNCENLVALWLSENQSKPLVPMHSEVDSHTYEQVLTCYLFPQVPLEPIELKIEKQKPETGDAQNSVRHISFVDMKPTVKVPEKGGQLRRAPTPYPKELRAMAKHARNIHKDGAQDVAPLQNPVHIKAAKITPTLQQRFATDNQKQDISSSGKENTNPTIQDPMNVSVYDNLPIDNTYDKPLDLAQEQDKTYKSVDHALYSENQVSEVNNYKDDSSTYSLAPTHYSFSQNDKYIRQDPSRNPSCQVQHSNFLEHESFPLNCEDSYRNCTEESCEQMQRLSLSSQDRHCADESLLASHFRDTSYDSRCMVDSNIGCDGIYSPKDTCYGRTDESFHESTYRGETYSSAREKLFGRKNYDVFNYHPNVTRQLPSPRLHTVSQIVSSTTMPNISHYNNIRSSPREDLHFTTAMHTASSANANMYDISSSSPTYVATQSPELYSPTGHTNDTNPYRMTNTPLVSDDGSFGHLQPMLPQNMYDLYEAIPASSTDPNIISRHSPNGPDVGYMRGQPPPYHIAAPYTKHAQYFNGTGG
ncbi:protein lap1 [Pieris rapae]|uniref:protein lap1 n=1 Tax=Pieris rapae TaxID=64459 RepID=UPI001E27B729|nr:protein lap1 [Pieris rapae]